MNNNEEIIVNVSFIVVFFLLGFCFRGICCNNNNEGVYLDRVIELQGELDELERQTNEVHQDQRRQINNQQAELREFRKYKYIGCCCSYCSTSYIRYITCYC